MLTFFTFLTIAVFLCHHRFLAFEINDVESELDEILISGVDTKVFTGVSAIAGSLDGSFTYKGAFGAYKYPGDPENDGIENAPVQLSSLFDMASCSKVIAGTSAIALLYQRGYLNLETPVAEILGDGFAQNGKGTLTIKNCLLHNAGFNPDPVPWYWDLSFGCPNSDDEFPAEDFSCLDKIYDSFLSESLMAPPGQIFKYSDLSFITLSMVVGTVVKDNKLVDIDSFIPPCIKTEGSSYMASILCHYEAFVRTQIFRFQPYLPKSFVPLMPDTQYIVPTSRWPDCVPTINDTGPGSYTHKRPQGQVSDGNTYAMGGISGHAGVFSNVHDLANFAKNLLSSVISTSDVNSATIQSNAWGSSLLNSTTLRLFTKQYNSTQSSRALGWDTNSFDVTDYGYSNSCGNWSSTTFMHIGYTGTMICLDPDLQLYSVFLSNRVYNCQGQSCSSNMSEPVHVVQRAFNNLVKDTVLAAREGRK
jgi:CubicO group peptidase (beta-lactamase class C family)